MARAESIGLSSPLHSSRRAVAVWLLLCIAVPSGAAAAAFEARVVDAAGAPLADAVVSLRATGATGATPLPAPAGAVMDQRDKTFVPHVLVVQRGAAVRFPNSDQIRHHVYSFSEPKRFELRLYKGTPAEPVVFDRAGTVVLGCNIHDSMLAFVRVVDTPWFGKTDASGVARIDGVPAGAFVAESWHPRLGPAAAPIEAPVALVAGADATLDVKLELGPEIVVSPRKRGLRDRARTAASGAP